MIKTKNVRYFYDLNIRFYLILLFFNNRKVFISF